MPNTPPKAPKKAAPITEHRKHADAVLAYEPYGQQPDGFPESDTPGEDDPNITDEPPTQENKP